MSAWWLLIYVVVMMVIAVMTRDTPDIGLFMTVAISLSFVSGNILGYADIFRRLGLVEPNGTITHSALDRLYFSIVTWTSVGYGDLRPLRDGRPFAAAECLLGYISMAVFFGVLLNLLFAVRDATPPKRR